GRRGGPAPHHRLVPRGSGGLTPAAAGRASGRPAERGPRGGPARLRGQQERRRGPPAAQQVAGADAAGDDQPAGDQRAARPGRPRSRAGGSVCSTAVPAVSETDSTTAIGSTSTSSTASDGDSPATTCSSPPAAASAPTRRTDGLRSRAPSTAPTMPPTARTVDTVPKAPAPPASGPVTRTARVSA